MPAHERDHVVRRGIDAARGGHRVRSLVGQHRLTVEVMSWHEPLLLLVVEPQHSVGHSDWTCDALLQQRRIGLAACALQRAAEQAEAEIRIGGGGSGRTRERHGREIRLVVLPGEPLERISVRSRLAGNLARQPGGMRREVDQRDRPPRSLGQLELGKVALGRVGQAHRSRAGEIGQQLAREGLSDGADAHDRASVRRDAGAGGGLPNPSTAASGPRTTARIRPGAL